MAYPSKCSECGALLKGKRPSSKTCSDSCRQKRSRRMKRQRNHKLAEGELPAALKPIAGAVRSGELQDVGHKVMAEELRPVIRESITDDTLKALRQMVALAPIAVERLAQDMQSEDPALRSKAYDLWFRYTVGQKDIRSPEADQGTGVLHVHFAMPRPPADPDAPVALPEPEGVVAEADELKVCDVCRVEKPASAMVAQSTRCQECHDKMVERVASFLSDGGKDGAN